MVAGVKLYLCSDLELFVTLWSDCIHGEASPCGIPTCSTGTLVKGEAQRLAIGCFHSSATAGKWAATVSKTAQQGVLETHLLSQGVHLLLEHCILCCNAWIWINCKWDQLWSRAKASMVSVPGKRTISRPSLMYWALTFLSEGLVRCRCGPLRNSSGLHGLGCCWRGICQWAPNECEYLQWRWEHHMECLRSSQRQDVVVQFALKGIQAKVLNQVVESERRVLLGCGPIDWDCLATRRWKVHQVNCGHVGAQCRKRRWSDVMLKEIPWSKFRFLNWIMKSFFSVSVHVTWLKSMSFGARWCLLRWRSSAKCTRTMRCAALSSFVETGGFDSFCFVLSKILVLKTPTWC